MENCLLKKIQKVHVLTIFEEWKKVCLKYSSIGVVGKDNDSAYWKNTSS